MQLPRLDVEYPPFTEPQVASEPVSKTQGIRIADVMLFGPLMVLGALNKQPPAWTRLAMLFIGIGTIAYNAKNFIAEADREKKMEKNLYPEE